MVEVPMLAFILETVIIIIGGVWTVASIKSTTEILNNTIQSLKETVVALKITLDEIDKKQDDHETRIRILEEFGSGNGRHKKESL